MSKKANARHKLANKGSSVRSARAMAGMLKSAPRKPVACWPTASTSINPLKIKAGRNSATKLIVMHVFRVALARMNNPNGAARKAMDLFVAVIRESDLCGSVSQLFTCFPSVPAMKKSQMMFSR